MRTTPYRPMRNGQVERFNRTLLIMLGTLPSDQKLNWQGWVNDLVQAYNCSVSGVMGLVLTFYCSVESQDCLWMMSSRLPSLLYDPAAHINKLKY